MLPCNMFYDVNGSNNIFTFLATITAQDLKSAQEGGRKAISM